MRALCFAVLLACAGLMAILTAVLMPKETLLPSVALLPLDSRPVNTDLPRRLAAIGGIELALPEPELLDQFLTTSDTVGLYAWLEDEDEKAHDLTIIHMNELIFGSLLLSRDSSQYVSVAPKLQSLYDYLLARPHVPHSKIVLVYILPRLLPSQYDEDMWDYEKELYSLSQLRHRLELEDEEPEIRRELSIEISALEEAIPRQILSRYETVFVQAFNTAKSMLDWADAGLIDEAVIGLDDSAEYGANVKVYEELRALAAQRGLEGAYFLNGADELAPLIIARHCLDITGSGAADGFSLRYLSEGQGSELLPYEAITLEANFTEKRDYLYGQDLLYGGKGDTLPKHIYVFSEREEDSGQLKGVWERLRDDDARPSSALVGLVDIAKVNGAWAPLIESIGADKVYTYVDAYAGWNTAGNSLGTVMAQLAFLEAARGFGGQQQRAAYAQHENLQKLRLIDDYFFQSVVRQQFIDWSYSEGFHYLTFGGRWMEANEKLTTMMDEVLEPWSALQPEPKPIYSFPWPRSFEIRVEIRYDNE